MRIHVAIKWSALKTEFDPLTGSAATLESRFGLDPASEAALEWALVLGAAGGAEVIAITAGPASADGGLRAALAAGASGAVRIDTPAAVGGIAVAAALAPHLADADVVLCGAWSADGGSASVAPALAARLDRPQACGMLGLAWRGSDLVGERRLPGGRRERLRITPPAVVSVEPGTAGLRRASMPAMLAASRAAIPVVDAGSAIRAAAARVVEPYRPRPRSIPPPPAGADHRERIQSLAGTTESAGRAKVVRLDPPEAAAAIVEALTEWGYLGGEDA